MLSTYSVPMRANCNFLFLLSANNKERVDRDFQSKSLREEGVPVGLQGFPESTLHTEHIVPYLNSMLQIYFALPQFVENLCKFSVQNLPPLLNPEKPGKLKRKVLSLELLSELQCLFGYLWNSNRKYVQADSIASRLADDCGNPAKAGDVGEFHRNLLLRVNEALELAGQPKLEVSDTKESQALGMSVLPPVITEQLAKSFVLNYCFGSFQVVTKAVDKDGSETELTATNAFSHVVIDPSKEDLYRCWEASYFADTESPQTPSVFSPSSK